jgi:hypothetical protein
LLLPLRLLVVGPLVVGLLVVNGGCRTSQATDAAPARGIPSASPAPKAEPSPDPTVPAVVGKDSRTVPAAALATLPHFTMSLGQIKPCAVEPYLNPTSGQIVLGIEVTLVGTSSVEVPVNSLYAKLEGDGGESYEATLAGCAPALQSTRVRNGDRVHGVISFVVPDGHSAWKLHYHPAVIGFPDEEARFDLGMAPSTIRR